MSCRSRTEAGVGGAAVVCGPDPCRDGSGSLKGRFGPGSAGRDPPAAPLSSRAPHGSPPPSPLLRPPHSSEDQPPPEMERGGGRRRPRGGGPGIEQGRGGPPLGRAAPRAPRGVVVVLVAPHREFARPPPILHQRLEDDV